MRYRWYKAEWEISIRELAEKLKSNLFSESVLEGFVIDRVRDDSLEARFVERINVIEKSIDPFGNDLLFERTEYKQTTFRASSYWPGLELTNPPRGVQNLFMRLSELNDFKVVFAPLKLDVLKWADAFQNKANTTAIVDSLQITALTLQSNITAKVIIKGNVDVRESSENFTQGKKYNLQKIQLLIQGSSPVRVVLTNEGAAKIEVSGSDDGLLVALRPSVNLAP